MMVQLPPACAFFVEALHELAPESSQIHILCNEYVLLQVEVEMDRKLTVSEMLE